ncbi:MAG: hypothetical protein ACKOTB_08885 [Planctomycetia bacterium]
MDWLPSLGHTPNRLRRALLGSVLGAMALAVWACGAGIVRPAFGQAGVDRPGLPELVRTKHRTFAIPFRLPAPKDADAAPQRVSMSVSKDLGATWEPAGEASPETGRLTYQATTDGEYWFRLRSIDRKGRVRGGEGPDMRVLVDAAGPRLAARVWKGSDGEILCRYAAIDDSIRMDSLKLEYKTGDAQGWKTVAAQGVLSRDSPAHLVGEEIWWAGEKVGSLTVRLTVADSAGNQTVRQFTLEANDPGIDQDALAREIGAPSLPAAESASAQDVAQSAPIAAVGPRSPAGWAGEKATAWSAEQPAATPAQPGRDGPQSVLVARATAGAKTPSAAETGSTRGLLSSTDALPPQLTSGQSVLEYRGKPLQLSRSRRFAWDYELPTERLQTARVRVELWSTRDGGLSWQRSAVDDDAVSPVNVVLPAAGLYGFRLEVVPDVPDAGPGPRPGDVAESWIGIDEDPPHVELLAASRLQEGEESGVLVRYTSHDQLPAPKSARLLFSPNAEGPWATIAKDLDNQGEHRWQPDRATPARVFVRVEVTDAAGNVGAATTPEPVTVSASRIVGRLGGVRTLPTDP